MSDRPDDLKFEITNILSHPRVRNVTDWYHFGLFLGVPPTTLHIINLGRDLKKHKTEMLLEWLKLDPEASWDKLFSALERTRDIAIEETVYLQHQHLCPEQYTDFERGDVAVSPNPLTPYVQSKETLFNAVKLGEVDRVQTLLENGGTNVNRRNKDRWTALFIAAEQDDIAIVQLLLTHNAKVDIRNKDGCTALFIAAEHGYIAVVQILLEHMSNKDVDIRNKKGWIALFFATEQGEIEVMKMLLKHSTASVDIRSKDGWTALFFAVKLGRVEVVQTLLDNGAKVDIISNDEYGNTALTVASKNGHAKTTKVLLDNGAFKIIDYQDKKFRSSLVLACMGNHDATVNVLLVGGASVDLKDLNGWTALFFAAELGNIEVVQTLLNKGAKVDIISNDEYGNTALTVASKNGHAKTTKVLLDNGAFKIIDYQDKDGWTALFFAADLGHIELVQTLLNKGAKVDIISDDEYGNTALTVASKNGHAKTTKLLLDNGAFIDYQNKKGHSSLILASVGNHNATVNILIDMGASVDIQDHDGRTAISFAAELGLHETVQTLLKSRANVDIICKTTGWSALFFACKKGFTDIARCLLDGRADVKLIDKDGMTAFNIAKLNDNENICDLLMNHYSVTKVTERGLTQEICVPQQEHLPETKTEPTEEQKQELKSVSNQVKGWLERIFLKELVRKRQETKRNEEKLKSNQFGGKIGYGGMEEENVFGETNVYIMDQPLQRSSRLHPPQLRTRGKRSKRQQHMGITPADEQ